MSTPAPPICVDMYIWSSKLAFMFGSLVLSITLLTLSGNNDGYDSDGAYS
jgi:hypothetical protein